MRLYLVQHGKAVDKAQDPQRPLAAEGVRDVEAVSQFVAPLLHDVTTVWHSGKTRAEQTAQWLMRGVNPKAKTSEHPGLAPNDPVKPLCEELAGRDQDLVIVGHLPHLAKLASRLLCGNEDADVVAFQMGGVVCLERDQDGVWRIQWMVVPALVS